MSHYSGKFFQSASLISLVSADQLLLSQAWYNNNDFFFFKAAIFNPPWLYNPTGKFKGYPFRTQHHGNSLSGFSDHFRVFALFALQE